MLKLQIKAEKKLKIENTNFIRQCNKNHVNAEL